MKLAIFLIVGVPGETLVDMVKTVILNLRIRPEGVYTQIFMPFVGTPLYTYCVENNLIDEERRRKMIVFTYSTCLKVGILKRFFIILFKWVNSATPVVSHFKISLVQRFFLIVFNGLFRKKIDFMYKRRDAVDGTSLKKVT